MIPKRLLAVLLIACAVMLAAGPAPASPGVAGGAPPVKGSESEKALASTSVLNGQIRISLPTAPECDRYQPAVAYNSTRREYLVVWHNTWPDGHRDIYARRLSERGELKSWFAVSAGARDRLQPTVAWNSDRDEYLVVWMYNAKGDGTTYDVWGRRVSHDGSWMGPEFEIISWPNRTFWSPRLAYCSVRNRYLVVWNALDATTLVPTDVASALLEWDGTTFSRAIISDAGEPHQVDVAYFYLGDWFLVVWRQMWSPSDGDIMAAKVAGINGSVESPPGVYVVNDDKEDQRFPSAASNGWDHSIVAWEHAYPGPCCDWDIKAQELDGLGGLVGGVFTVAGSYEDETAPRVTTGPKYERKYLAVWQRSTGQGETVWAKAWGDPGWQFFGEVASGTAWHYENPAVAAGGPNALIAYEGDSGSNPLVYRHIYGRRWVAYALYLPLVERNR